MHHRQKLTEDEYYDLGSYHRRISTTNRDSQVWFDRGLIWSYAFNHEEAVDCFEAAIIHDSNCSMAYWGLAYALGPNYNKPWEFFDDGELGSVVKRTHEAVAKATMFAEASSAVEQALIAALQSRYPQDVPSTDLGLWNAQYADAMGKVHRDFKDDLDIAALYADALMNITPWQLWDLRTGDAADGAHTLQAKQVLEHALAQPGGPTHPGLLHLYIHLMEMSSSPESALGMADRLRNLVPDAGHLQHMPSHLDVLCGDYSRAVVANSDAIRADEKFLAQSGPLNFYTLYRCHDFHFLIYAAMFSGQSQTALDGVSQLEASLPEALLRVESPPMADWLEGFLSVRVHVLVRFGRWQDLIELPVPSCEHLYSVTTAMIHYGKGVALAATARVPEADDERESFHAALHRVPESRMLFNNKCIDILHVAQAMLDGEIEYRRGNHDAAFDHLRRSTDLYDALPYDEPWGWMQPTRHALGALLLERGHVEEAATVYKADLGLDATLPRAFRHPNNVWALRGYHECLVRLDQPEEAAIVETSLSQALAVADVPINVSCYCRK